MAGRLTFMTIYLVVLCLLIGGAIVLQIYLSKRENKWLGFIMPGIFFCFSLIAILGNISYSVANSILELSIPVLLIGFTMNIPTFILLSIYFGCRQKQSKNRELEKMNIQDLE